MKTKLVIGMVIVVLCLACLPQLVEQVGAGGWTVVTGTPARPRAYEWPSRTTGTVAVGNEDHVSPIITETPTPTHIPCRPGCWPVGNRCQCPIVYTLIAPGSAAHGR